MGYIGGLYENLSRPRSPTMEDEKLCDSGDLLDWTLKEIGGDGGGGGGGRRGEGWRDERVRDMGGWRWRRWKAAGDVWLGEMGEEGQGERGFLSISPSHGRDGMH